MRTWYLVDAFLLLIQQVSVCMCQCGCRGECSARGCGTNGPRSLVTHCKHVCLPERTHYLIFPCKLAQPPLFSISVANTITGLPLISWSPSGPMSQSISYGPLDSVPSRSSSGLGVSSHLESLVGLSPSSPFLSFTFDPESSKVQT